MRKHMNGLREFIADTTSVNTHVKNHGTFGFTVRFRGDLIARTTHDDGVFCVEINGNSPWKDVVEVVVRACRRYETNHLTAYDMSVEAGCVSS